MQKTDSKSDRDKQVQVRLPAALHKQLKLALIQDDSSLADFFNEAANAYLKNPDKYRKAVGSIVCFRDLEKETNDAIALFGDKEANGIVLLKSYDDYYYGCVDDIEDYKLLCDCHINTAEELFAFREDIDAQIDQLNVEREHIRNKIRRAPETEKPELKLQAKAVTQKTGPLRKQQRIAKRIAERTPQIESLLAMERQQEAEFMKGDKNNERNKSRTFIR